MTNSSGRGETTLDYLVLVVSVYVQLSFWTQVLLAGAVPTGPDYYVFAIWASFFVLGSYLVKHEYRRWRREQRLAEEESTFPLE